MEPSVRGAVCVLQPRLRDCTLPHMFGFVWVASVVRTVMRWFERVGSRLAMVPMRVAAVRVEN